MRDRIQKLLASWYRKLTPQRTPGEADRDHKIRYLEDRLDESAARDAAQRRDYMERASELIEAHQMAGAGPWAVQKSTGPVTGVARLRESIASQGAFADVELALQNIEWRREINLSLMEFSRWGIQNIILICRLYWIKHPWIRRGVNLSAAYVFGQGVELSSPDSDANDVLTEFVVRNKSVLGQVGLTKQERRKSHDGNIFWALFTDRNRGQVTVRIIDATEMQEIITDPEDSEQPWYYRRMWTRKATDPQTGNITTTSEQAYYPALNYEPAAKPARINNYEVHWDTPVYHRKCGEVPGWLWGCPRVYPAIEYSREGKRFLDSWASVWAALRQVTMTITTKGGQQAIEGMKQQTQTSAGPSSSLLDINPPAIAGSTMVSGPGTVLSAVKTAGASGSPKDICELRNMVACVLEIPPTWLGDMETSNLSTAKTLDRPTELGILLKQEEWQEDLVTMGQYQLVVSGVAPAGRLKEAFDKRRLIASAVMIREAARKVKDCHWVYEAAKTAQPAIIEVLATFPPIREGDLVERTTALVMAGTLGNRGGQIVGTDEKATVLELMRLHDFPQAEELIERMYPESEYEPDRTKEVLEPPIPKLQPRPGGTPVESDTIPHTEAALDRLHAALLAREVAKPNGTATNSRG